MAGGVAPAGGGAAPLPVAPAPPPPPVTGAPGRGAGGGGGAARPAAGAEKGKEVLALKDQYSAEGQKQLDEKNRVDDAERALSEASGNLNQAESKVFTEGQNARGKSEELRRAGEERESFKRQLDELRAQIRTIGERLSTQKWIVEKAREQRAQKLDEMKNAAYLESRNREMELLRAILAAISKLQAKMAEKSLSENVSAQPAFVSYFNPAEAQFGNLDNERNELKKQESEYTAQLSQLSERERDPYPTNKVRDAAAESAKADGLLSAAKSEQAAAGSVKESAKGALDAQRALFKRQSDRVSGIQHQMDKKRLGLKEEEA